MDGYGYPMGYEYGGYPQSTAAAYLQPPLDQNLDPYCQQADGYGDYYGLQQLRSESEDVTTKTASHRRRRRDSSTASSESRSGSSITTVSSSLTEEDPRLQSGEFKQPSFLDAFRVLYLEDGNKSKGKTQYLMTKKKRDRIEELLELDGLGSKRLFVYPRSRSRGDLGVSRSRSSTASDRRVKVEGEVLSSLKSHRLDREDAPVAKLRRWELLMYKKLGFVQAV